jgi:hypothetical protein
MARVVRTTVASVASLQGFSMEEIDDVRLLVDEAFVALCSTGSRAVVLRLGAADGCVVIELHGDHPPGPVDTSALQTLASVLAVDFTIALTERPPRFRARLRTAA